MQFDDQDKVALAALDDFTISANGETAIAVGKILGRARIDLRSSKQVQRAVFSAPAASGVRSRR
jgi:hypothetical protein